MILFMPTLALVNSISLNQIKDAEKEFANIRVWGTIGWIASGLTIGWMAWEASPKSLNVTFLVAAAVSAGFGVFCFFLPNTPPPKAGKK